VRDWLYVQDHCDAINMILQKGTIGETYNVGGNNEIQNIQIVKDICTILDEVKPAESGKSYHQLITFVKDRPGHDFRYAIDSTKIKQGLGWQPHETFQSGLRKTINWYLDSKDWWIETQENIYQQERLGIV
jgi:dTDP-glucose 4,6-dehydratase